MSSRLLAVCLGVGFAGCASSRMLERTATRHEERAAVYAEAGNGERARREALQAQELRETSRRRAKRHGWFWSDVTLE
jgi:hypothetical protein